MIMKNIMRNVTGNVMENIMNNSSSAFNPLSLNPVFYYNGQDINSLPADDPVPTVNDVSGNGNSSLTQADSELQPDLYENNGLRGVNCAVGDNLQADNCYGLSGSPNITQFVIFEFLANTTTATGDVAKIGSGNGAGYQVNLARIAHVNGHKPQVRFANGSITYTSTINNNTKYLLTISRPAGENHNSTVLRQNGVQLTAETSSTNALNLQNDAYQIAGGSNSSNVIVYNILLCNAIFSESKLAEAESYLMGIYGIS